MWIIWPVLLCAIAIVLALLPAAEPLPAERVLVTRSSPWARAAGAVLLAAVIALLAMGVVLVQLA